MTSLSPLEVLTEGGFQEGRKSRESSFRSRLLPDSLVGQTSGDKAEPMEEGQSPCNPEVPALFPAAPKAQVVSWNLWLAQHCLLLL